MAWGGGGRRKGRGRGPGVLTDPGCLEDLYGWVRR